MAAQKRLIFEIKNLNKTINGEQVVNIRKLEFHPGAIYGIVGNAGSGKTKLMELLAGENAKTSGVLKFDDESYTTNWLGKVNPHPEIYYSHSSRHLNPNKTTKQIVNNLYKKKENIIFKRYFSSGSAKGLWEKKLSLFSPGELDLFSLVLSVESDPRVLLIDDYALRLSKVREQDFRSQLKRMNRNLGTTIILTSASDRDLEQFASVLVYVDNGHISKIRSSTRTKAPQKRKPKPQSKRRTKKPN